MRHILSFDAGIRNVGVVAAIVSDDWSTIEITHADCVDLTSVTHTRVPRHRCTLDHTNSLASRYSHYVQELGPMFDEADLYFVEQQPPQSAGMVFEQLLLLQCQGYTTSVHPSRIHKRYSLPKGDYEGRKAESCRVALSLFPALAPYMRSAARGHDIADAACILHFECERRHRSHRATAHKLDRFMYRPSHCRRCRVDTDHDSQSAYRAEDCPRCSVALLNDPSRSRGCTPPDREHTHHHDCTGDD